MSKFYNEKLKEEFLNSGFLPESSVGIAIALFKASKKFEKKWNKDLYEFTIDEIKEFIVRKMYTNTSTLANHIYVIRAYIDYNIANNNTNDYFNVAKVIEKEEFFSLITEKKEKTTIDSYEELDDLLSKCQSFQDKVTILGLSEGIRGERMQEELLLMEIQDIDVEKKEIKLYHESEDGKRVYSRTIPVSEKFISIAQEADKEIFRINSIGRRFKLKGNAIIKFARLNYGLKQKSWSLRQRMEDAYTSGDYKLSHNKVFYSGLALQLKKRGISLRELETDEAQAVMKNFGLRMKSKNKIKEILKEHYKNK